jgi:hypothetical protein
MAAPSGGRGHRPRAADDFAITQNQLKGLGVAILVHLDFFVMGDVPAERIDKKQIPQVQKVIKCGAVDVQSRQVEGDVFHGEFSF